MKVQDATKELSRRAAKLLGDVGSVRQAAEKTLAELRKIESGFVQKEEAEREEKRREEARKKQGQGHNHDHGGGMGGFGGMMGGSGGLGGMMGGSGMQQIR